MGDDPPFKKQKTADAQLADDAHDVIVNAWLSPYGPKARRLNKAEKEKATAETDKAIGVQHAVNMRAKRVRPEILKAIIAVRGHDNPDPHPYTVAARILPGVNAWLKEHGHKPILKKALAGRIAHT